SLFWAIVIIVVLMAMLFNSLRILLVALIPNVVPLIVTAGLMGFLDIPIKPSTMLVFGIALGIAVDNAIFFLARYRLEVKLTGGDLAHSVDRAVREVSVGIIYTSVVLVAGFSMFAFSRFGGIQALGMLTTITLLTAMLTNLLVLPSMVLSLNKRIMSKAFEEPLLETMDEEDELDMEALPMEGSPRTAGTPQAHIEPKRSHASHHPRRWKRHASASAHPGREQAAHARVRQADDLLPAEHPHGGGHTRDPHHQHPARPAPLPQAPGRRHKPGLCVQLCRAGRAQRAGTGLCHRARVRGQRQRGAHSRRQHLLRARIGAHAGYAHHAAGRA